MKNSWFFIYNSIVFPALYGAARAGSLFNEKIRSGIQGRKTLFKELEENLAKTDSRQPRIWFHVSSLGEFEQAKPIIQNLKGKYPDAVVIVTFFSPSGYNHSRSFKYADIISYLPFDSRASASRFVRITAPCAAVFIRYDVWPNFIWALSGAGIPILLADATLRRTSKRFSFILKNFHRGLFDHFDHILTVSPQDAEQFNRFGLTKPRIEVAGDTRYDQVWLKSTAAKNVHLFPEGFMKRKKVFVVGSSWQADEEHLFPVLKKLVKEERSVLTVLVPHEPTEYNLDRIQNELGDDLPSIRFSHINTYTGEKVIVVDSVGILLSLYRYAHIAYVGGAFRTGVHNVLEASVYGIPVVFGPRHVRSQEAIELVRRGGGFTVNDDRSMYRVLRLLFGDSEKRKAAGKIARELVYENIGATERIIDHLSVYINR
jgi:3-deoxy-D-manno-octulosonic-acid transferase